MFLILENRKKRKAKETELPPENDELVIGDEWAEESSAYTSDVKVPEIDQGLKEEDMAPPDYLISDLVERAKGGEDDAFSELVLHYEKFVFNTACKALSAGGRSVDAADDVAQAAFIKAWRSIKRFRGDCTFSTWLYRITVNTARDMLRHEARHGTVSLSRDADEDEENGSEWDVPVTSGDSVPEYALDRKEAILAVRRAVESLPQEHRQVIVMRDLHELTYQEISERLGLEPGTVRSRINRGRQKLKNILESGNFFDFPSSKQ